jgi:Uma2 family endonuclease
MSVHPAYDSLVDHEPKFLAYGLPADGVLDADGLHALPEDPFWTYQLLEGTLLITSNARTITWDDLQGFPDLPNWRFELLEGMLIVTPNAPDIRHQSCAGSLYLMLREACPPDLKVVIAPFEWLPEPELSMHPDVLIARKPVPLKRLIDPPLLSVEVLSRGTRTLDVTAKRSIYEERGVEHYWTIDPRVPSIQALRLVDGKYQVVAEAAAGEIFQVGEPVPVSFDPLVLLDE